MTDTSTWLENIGVNAPPDFPAASYNMIFLTVRTRAKKQALWDEFGGAWNAVAYRFLAVVHYADAFRDSIAAHGSTPKAPMRSEQERILFGFFTNAMSCLEATYYGLFAVGAYLAPRDFPLATPNEQRRVDYLATCHRYAVAFPARPIVEALRLVVEDDAFKAFRYTRNILAHRSQPGRRMYVSLGDTPEQRDERKLGALALTPDALTSRQTDVARLLRQLLEAAVTFVSGRF